jgi:hypothetical protein
MSGTHDLIPPKRIDLDWIGELPEEKRIPLLAILTHTDFAACAFFRSQLEYLVLELQNYPSNLISRHELARIFRCNVGSITYQLSRLNGRVRPIGRPSLLTLEADHLIERLVADAYARREPISLVYLIEQIQFFFNISVSRDTMGHIVLQMPTVKLVECIPMDRSRVMADPQAIDDLYANIPTLIIDIPRAIIVNMDESVFADYPDARRETVVVPEDDQADEIPRPFDRRTKRVTLVAAIAAEGTALTHPIVLTQKTLETEHIMRGSSEQKATFRSQEEGSGRWNSVGNGSPRSPSPTVPTSEWTRATMGMRS